MKQRGSLLLYIRNARRLQVGLEHRKGGGVGRAGQEGRRLILHERP